MPSQRLTGDVYTPPSGSLSRNSRSRDFQPQIELREPRSLGSVSSAKGNARDPRQKASPQNLPDRSLKPKNRRRRRKSQPRVRFSDDIVDGATWSTNPTLNTRGEAQLPLSPRSSMPTGLASPCNNRLWRPSTKAQRLYSPPTSQVEAVRLGAPVPNGHTVIKPTEISVPPDRPTNANADVFIRPVLRERAREERNRQEQKRRQEEEEVRRRQQRESERWLRNGVQPTNKIKLSPEILEEQVREQRHRIKILEEENEIMRKLLDMRDRERRHDRGAQMPPGRWYGRRNNPWPGLGGIDRAYNSPSPSWHSTRLTSSRGSEAMRTRNPYDLNCGHGSGQAFSGNELARERNYGGPKRSYRS